MQLSIAKYLMHADCHLTAVRDSFGHESGRSTQTYAQFSTRRDARIVEVWRAMQRGVGALATGA